MIRLWIEYPINQTNNTLINLSTSQIHYLTKVMRKEPGDKVLIFNRDGEEWLCELLNHKTLLSIELVRTKPKQGVIRSIAIACIKKHRMEDLIEKATEIGVDKIYLLDTNYSQRVHYNIPRLNAIAIEAAEQSYRLDLPIIYEAQKLDSFLTKTDAYLLLCHQEAVSMESVIPELTNEVCCLIGPEGGWSPKELELMANLQRINLNRNVLRAETAAMLAAQHLQLY